MSGYPPTLLRFGDHEQAEQVWPLARPSLADRVRRDLVRIEARLAARTVRILRARGHLPIVGLARRDIKAGELIDSASILMSSVIESQRIPGETSPRG